MNDVIERREDAIAVLTINRPERANALSLAMLTVLTEALRRLAKDDKVGAVVLTGAGRAFCAGGDVKDLAGRERDSLATEAERLRSRSEICSLLHEIPKVTIAAVNGAAAGAGLGLALACDLRIAATSARFSTSFVKVGLSGDFGSSYFLTKFAGSAKARELFFTGDIIGAQEALTLGIVNKVVPDEALMQESMAFAARIAAGPPLALAHMKRVLNLAETGRLTDVLEAESWAQSMCRETQDHLEAAAAFLEKRRPIFKGN